MIKSTKVSEIMSNNIIVANESHKFSQVCRLFLEFSLHHLPVVNSENKVIGIISSSDALRIYCYESPIIGTTDPDVLDSKLPLSGMMTTNPFTINTDDTIGYAAEMMVKHGVQSLPVVNESGTIVGIVTSRDLVKEFALYG